MRRSSRWRRGSEDGRAAEGRAASKRAAQQAAAEALLALIGA